MPDQNTVDTDAVVRRLNVCESLDATSMGTLLNSTVTSAALKSLFGTATTTVKVSDFVTWLVGVYSGQPMISIVVTGGKSATKSNKASWQT